MKAYCLNLRKSTDRKIKMEAQFEREGLEVQFIEAVDARVENPELETEIYIGDWGNLMSHRKVWEDMIENDHKMALVFEDQAKLVTNFSQKLNEIKLPEKWDVIYLGALAPVPSGPESTHLKKGKALGTWATLISLECAKKLWAFDPYDWVSPDVTIASMPLKTFYTKEKLAIRDRTTPTIGGVNFITRGSLKPLFICHILQWLPVLEILFIILLSVFLFVNFVPKLSK